MSIRRPIWRYGLFQIPSVLLILSLIAAGVAYLLGLGCPQFWVSLFLGLAWIALVWMLVMPLDYFLKFALKLQMSFAGRIAIFHAIFWTVLTSVVLASTLPTLIGQCRALELISLDWSRWHANIWNEMFLNSESSAPIGSKAEFQFIVKNNRRIEDIQISASDLTLESYVQSRIKSLEGKKILEFVPDTRRDEVRYESKVNICRSDEPGCGEPADPDDYPDTEEYMQ